MSASTGELAFAWRPCAQTYEIRYGQTYLFHGLRPLIVLEDGRLLPTGRGNGLEVRVELEKATLDGHPAVLITMGLTNQSREAVRVSAFLPFSAPLPGAGGPASLFRNGWQSWSHAGRWPLDLPDPDFVDTQSPHRHGHPRRHPPANGEPQIYSDWLAVFDGDPWLALGFVTGRDQFGDITIARAADAGATGQAPHVIARSLADGYPLDPGETLLSETLAILAGRGNPWSALEALAAETGRRAGRLSTGPALPPTGWCTWYHYFHGITQETVVADLGRLAALGPRLPLSIFQIDDGYQAAIGNWLETNPRFPRGMKWLASRVRAAGLQPGLWLAPFSVMPGAPAYDDHPDWILRDATGEPVEAGMNWGGPFYGLDVTHPEVPEHLRHLFRTVVRDWGYRYLKLDFIYCAALPGRRADPRVTRAQALRRALEIVREEVPEAYILACGSPLVPAVGLVNGMRIGPDVAPFWRAPSPLGADPSFPSTVNSLRNVFSRAFTHGRLWDSDPDCLLVRDRDTLLSPDEVRTLATALACSGGSLFLSDAPDAVPEDRLSIVRQVLPPSGRPAVPAAPLAEEFPSAVAVPPPVAPRDAADDEDPARIRHLTAAFFNWSDEVETTRTVDIVGLLDATGLKVPAYEPDDRELAWHVFDFWAGRYIGRFTEDVALVRMPELPPHSCAVLGLVEHRQNVPTVVGSDRHLVQGPPVIHQERSKDGGLLTVNILPGGFDKVRIWVAVPLPFRLAASRPAAYEPGGGVLEPAESLTQVWGRVVVFQVPMGAAAGGSTEAGPRVVKLFLRFDQSRITYVKQGG